MPAPAALDQFDPMPGVALGKIGQRARDVSIAREGGNVLDRDGLRCCEDGRFDGSHEIVHQAAVRTIRSAK